MFSIGRFARLAGVSAKALRAYDAFGLFRPAWIDPATAYRYYSPAQLPGLRRVLALRDMGMPLAEIRDLAEGGDLDVALRRRREDLQRQRREIDRRLRALDITIDASASDAVGDVVVRPIGAEPVATLAVRDDEDDGAAFYELEAYVRDLGRRAHRPPGALVPRDDEAGQAVEIFVPVNGPVPSHGRIAYRRLPAVRAATLIQGGPYDRLVDGRRTLERWVRRTGLEPGGPLRIIYLQFGAERELNVPAGYVVERPADYLTELQFPIEPSGRGALSPEDGAPGSGPSRARRRSARPR